MIALNEFKKRREAVMHALPADAIAIIPGACEQVRNMMCIIHFGNKVIFYI